MNNKSRVHFIKEFAAVLLALAIVDRFIAWGGLDMRVQNFFYDKDLGWYLGDIPLFRYLFMYGEKVAWVPVIISAILLALSFLSRTLSNGKYIIAKVTGKVFSVDILRKHRKSFVFVILLMAIGPGLIVNTALKDTLGRPRPREVVEFGGTHEFVGTWSFADAGKNSSFPSGHSSVAFYMIFPFFLLRGKNKLAAVLFLIAGILYGALMSIARMAQGGHFLSDVIWSGGIIYLTALSLEKGLLTEKGVTPIFPQK